MFRKWVRCFSTRFRLNFLQGWTWDFTRQASKYMSSRVDRGMKSKSILGSSTFIWPIIKERFDWYLYLLFLLEFSLIVSSALLLISADKLENSIPIKNSCIIDMVVAPLKSSIWRRSFNSRYFDSTGQRRKYNCLKIWIV